MSTDQQLLPEMISPEGLEVAEAYISAGHDTKLAAELLNLPVESVAAMLKKREVKHYLDNIFMEQGFRNRDKFFGVMDTIIELKLEELEESKMGSSADILEIMKTAHKMKMDEMKLQIELLKLEAAKPTNQTNIQNNFSIPGGQDSQYMNLLGMLSKAGKK
ncbi:terminase small subunit [Serratia phage Slocum]|nr:terminase small subunit [Serratia phage Slocum]